MKLKNLSSNAISILTEMAEICRNYGATKDEKDAAFETIREICFPTEPIDLESECLPRCDEAVTRLVEAARELITADPCQGCLLDNYPHECQRQRAITKTNAALAAFDERGTG